jgi:hypothetical protein
MQHVESTITDEAGSGGSATTGSCFKGLVGFNQDRSSVPPPSLPGCVQTAGTVGNVATLSSRAELRLLQRLDGHALREPGTLYAREYVDEANVA